MNSELSLCCQSAAAHETEQRNSAPVVPWLLGAKPIWSSTIARVSGQKRRGQRGIIPPWLCPTMEILRPARAYIVLIPLTTYSPATWMSPSACPGSVTPHHAIPSLSSAGCQFHEKL